LNLPVDHDALIAAVTDLEEIGFVEKADQRRCHEVIVFGRMMIDRAESFFSTRCLNRYRLN